MRVKTLELLNFSGGINNVIEPHLLELHFAKDLQNCAIHNGAIKSNNGMIAIDTQDSELIYQTGERSIVKWGGAYYWTDNSSGVNGSTLGYLGVEKPQGLPTLAEGGAGGRFISGKTYSYTYSFQTTNGFRSGPVSISQFATITPSTDQGIITLSNFDSVMEDHVSIIEVWRTVANGAVFYKAGEINRFLGDSSGDIVFEDNATDAELLTHEQLDMQFTDDLPTSGKYLCEKNSVFFMAAGDRVYFSKQSNPHSYPALQFVVFDDDVTGMIASETYVLVFTLNRAYMLSGDSMADIAKQELPDAQGVSNWKTISRVKNMPIWVSNDGVCAFQAYDNRSGRKIGVLSENRVKVPAGAVSAAVANDIYYLFYDNETYAFDFLKGLKVYRLDWALDWAWYDKSNDRLVGKKNEVYYHAGGGDEQEFYYLSPEFTFGDMQRLKQLSRIYIDSSKSIEISFIIDKINKWSFTSSHKGMDQRTHFVKAGLHGRRVQLEIKGKGSLQGVRLDYSIRRL